MNGKKILVIDFDQSFLQFMTENLAKQGFQVLTATDGFSGFWKYKAEAPDLVLSEILLPKLHGFELCSRIHADTEKKTPVIFITGVQKDESYRKEAMETFGAVDYFDKPVNISAVLSVIRRVLEMPGETAEPAAETAKPAPPQPEAEPPAKETTPVEPPDPPAETQISAPTMEKPKPKRRTTDITDIDALLKGTLDEIGFKRTEKTTKTALPKIPTPPPSPVPPPAAARATGRPTTRSVETQPRIQTEDRVRKTTGSIPIEKADIFDTYKESSDKKGFPIVPIAGGVIVVAAALFFFVLKPGEKTTSNTSSAASLAAQAIAQQAERVAESEVPAEAEIEESVPEQEAPPPVEKPAPTPAKSEPAPAKAEPERKPAPTPEPAAILALPEASLAVDKPAPSKPEAKAPPVKSQAEEPSVKAGDIVPLQNVDVEPQLLKSVQPVYPESARRFRIEGTVVVNMLISETGEVIDARTVRGIKGYPAFEKVAESAVRKWRFRPATKDGVAVKVWKVESFKFTPS
ncbi:MAG: TonB family protein [Acidobacteriota bacterium]|nr:TonB family protein [Acidobacteriota bacterium]